MERSGGRGTIHQARADRSLERQFGGNGFGVIVKIQIRRKARLFVDRIRGHNQRADRTASDFSVSI